MKDILALVTITIWPAIPVYWIPVHWAPGFFRKLGRLTFLFVFLIWSAIAYTIYRNRELIIAHRADFPVALSVAGMILLFSGTLLQIWTAFLLTLPGIIGIPEISEPQTSKLVDKGPFGVVRHPTYLAHTMMFLGIYLITGVTAVGILTFADFFIVVIAVIPLEERELLKRLGQPYRKYMHTVPRLLPHVFRRK